MSFGSPFMLLTLALLPILLGAYMLLMQQRRARAGELGLVAAGSGGRPTWRRHLPPAIFLLAAALLLVGLARPKVSGFPHREGTVILAFDVSGSMKADDLKPTRMDAERQAAEAFVKSQPSSIKIGVVAFGNGAIVVQEPTSVQADILAAIDRLTPEGGTSLGEGIMTSLGAIAGKPIVLDQAAQQGDLESVNIGYFGSAVIVLLSDGENLSGFDPLNATQIAGNAGVRVFTVGVGSADGATIDIDGYRVATALNEPLLQEIASRTGATYYTAEHTSDLIKIYRTIDLHLTTKGEPLEVTSLAAMAAMALIVAGGGLSLRWFGRVP